MFKRHHLSVSLLSFAVAGILALPSIAQAQGPWGPWGPYGPYGPGPYRGYPRYVIDEFSAALRFDVKPKDAEVYVDGALAGEIDDFDGVFQSLRLRPGNHEIVVYREGFRSVREQIYLEPYHERKLRFDLEPLRAGDAQEPRPQAPPPGVNERERYPRQGPPPPPQREPDRRLPPDPRPAPAQFGTLSIRVVPADAEVFVDGERWTGPATGDRLSIRLSSGRHRIEVRKQGFASYAEEILIRSGSTLTLNVSLK